MQDPAAREQSPAPPDVPAPMLVLAGVAAALSLLAAVLAAAAGTAPVDFAVYLGASRTIGHGGATLYSSVFGSLQFTYPPAAALIYVPLRGLPLSVASVVWSIVLVASLAASCWLLAGAFWGARASLRVRWMITLIASALGIWIEAMQSTLLLGQIDLLIMLLVIVDLTGALARIPRGVLIGIAAGIKLTPLLLIAYLLVTRRFAQARNAALAFVATVVVGFLVLPHGSIAFWRHALFDASRVTRLPAWIVNSSLRGVLLRALGTSTLTTVVWLLACLLVVVVGFALLRQCEPLLTEVRAGAMVMLLACVVSPVSWDHHFVWVLVPLLALVSPLASGWPGRFVMVGSLIAVFGLADYQLWNLPTRYALANDYPWTLQVLGALDVLAIVGLFAYVALIARHERHVTGAQATKVAPIPI